MNRTVKVILALSAAILFTNCFAVHNVQPYFAKPYSGKRVQQYDITLPLSRSEKKSFTIPTKCNELTSALLSGAGQWGNRIERRMWLKVDDDCRYYAFLTQNQQHADKDFVSSHDFYNADIADFPLRPGCDPMLFLTNPMGCPPSIPGMPDFTQFFSAPAMPVNEEEERRTCTFEQGIFRGHIMNSGSGIHCIKNKRAPGLRLLSVDYADINGDGYQDAILRLHPIGRGVSMVPMMLPLTRFQEDGSFSIPQGVEFPNLGPSTW